MSINYYFFNRKDPSNSVKKYMSITRNSNPDDDMLVELEEFFNTHELYTANIDEDCILITFCNTEFCMIIYPDDNATTQNFTIEAEDYNGQNITIVVPIDKFAVYEDGMNLIIGSVT